MAAAATTIFGSCGEVVVVAESAIEAIAAVSGCGPGYVFMLIDALADAGVNAGLPRAMAIKLAAQTFAGSGKMVLETGMHPGAAARSGNLARRHHYRRYLRFGKPWCACCHDRRCFGRYGTQ